VPIQVGAKRISDADTMAKPSNDSDPGEAVIGGRSDASTPAQTVNSSCVANMMAKPLYHGDRDGAVIGGRYDASMPAQVVKSIRHTAMMAKPSTTATVVQWSLAAVSTPARSLRL